MARRTRTGFWLLAIIPIFLAGLVVQPVAPVSAADPTARPFLGEDDGASAGTLRQTQTAAGTLAVAPGLVESTAFQGLTFPTNVRFASDGRVFVAEKSGLIKVFASMTATTPTVFADLRSKVDDYWDRGLLGLALAPNFPTDPYVYVAYTYDAPIGGTAPVWNDACPNPPGPTTDGCVVSSRVSRLQASGSVMTGSENVLINDWCQQFPSHSIGELQFGPDGALYVSGGDGASFTNADTGQFGGSAGSPTPKNPCNDPTNEGGALRAQDLRTMPSSGGSGLSYRATVLADSPLAYWRLGEPSGILVNDQVGTLTGWYGGTSSRGVAGAIVGDTDGAVSLDGTSGYVGVPDYGALDVANGPFSVEFWVKRKSTTGNQAIIDRGPGSYQITFSSTDGKLTVSRNGGGNLAKEATATTDTTSFHHFVVTKSGATTKIYKDGVDVTAPGTDTTLTNSTTNLWLGRWNDGTSFANVVLDDVAIYGTALTAAKALAHYQAGLAGGSGGGGGGGTDPVTLDGSIIRVDPTTGAAMPTNPLASSPDTNARRIIAHGVRNPFRFTFRPGTGEIWVGDVGYSDWEEIDRITSTTTLRNFGWPCYEGVGQQPGYAPAQMCQNLYADGAAPATGPYLTYNHQASVKNGDGCAIGSSAIAGIAFYTGTSYPTSLRNALFFADNSRDCIWAMLPTAAGGLPDPANIVTIASPAANPVKLEAGPGGDIFYVDFDGGRIQRLSSTSSNQAPTARIVANPTSGPAPLAVSFSGTTSSDPEGTTLTYAWDLDGDGQYNDGTAATASRTYTTAGTVTVGLRVTDTGGASGTTSVQISVGSSSNAPPVPVIDTPAASLTWSVGDQISFTGHATDPEDGPLAAAKLSWQLVLQHCPSNCHTHQLQTFAGVASGSFPAPDHDYPSYMELTLTATDSGNVSASTTVRLDPKTVVLSFRSVPTGLSLTVASAAHTTPYDHTAIKGGTVSVTAPSPQTLAGTTYTFASWSDGGAATHQVSAAAAATLTATYTGSGPAASYKDTVIADGPAAYWRLGDTSGIIATDAVGTRTGWYGGTMTRGAPGAIAGDSNGAVSLDGASGYVGVPGSSVPSLVNGPLTIEFWVKRNTASGIQALIDDGPGSYQIDFSSSNKLTVSKNNGGIIVAETGTTTDTTTWHHVVFTKNGSAVKLYKDGADVTGTVTDRTLTASSTNLWMGRWNDGTHFGNVALDEVAVYAKVLTAAQVAAHRSAGVGS